MVRNSTEVLRLLLSAPERIERVHDVLHVVPLKAVEMKVRSVKFGPDQSPTLLVPPKRRPIIPEI